MDVGGVPAQTTIGKTDGLILSRAPHTPYTHRPTTRIPIDRESIGDDERPFADLRRAINNALRVLLLHRWAFFVPFCAISSAVFVASLYYPREYSASTSFERQDDPVMFNLPQAEGTGSFMFFRSTLAEDVVSLENMRDVVDRLGLLRDAPPGSDEAVTESRKARARLAQSLAKCISVTARSPNDHTDKVTINYVGPDPEIGMRLVDEVKETYIRRIKAEVRERLYRQRDYFSERAKEALEKVNKHQRAETGLLLEHPGVDPKDPTAIASRLNQMRFDHRELERRKRALQADILAERQMLETTKPRIRQRIGELAANIAEGIVERLDPGVIQLVGRISALDTEIATLRSTRGMTLEHPEIQDLLVDRSELVAKLEKARAEYATAPPAEATREDAIMKLPPGADSDPSLQLWIVQQNRTRIKLEALRLQLDDVLASMKSNDEMVNQLLDAKQNVFATQEEFTAITSDLAAAKFELGQHREMLAKLQAPIDASEKGHMLQFFEIGPTRGGRRPVSPSSSTILLLSLLAGIAAGVAFAVLAEVLDHVYRSANQVARGLGLPILEAIDEIVTAPDRRRALVRSILVTPASVALGLGTLVISGSMAYLSIERPTTYEKIQTFHQAAVQLLIEKQPDQDDPSTGG